MNHHTRRFYGVVVSAAFASFAQAQQAAQSQSDTLEEVIVTAEKRPTDLQKIPSSVQVTSGEELRTSAKRRLDEIMDGVVGVQAQGSEVGSSFYMRGVGFDRGQMGPPGGSGPTQQAVAVIVDGVYQSRQETVRGGTLDVTQAEVSRGPQSTTLGGSSLAGAVSLVSNKPVFEYQARASVDVGNYDKVSPEAVLNVPLADNQALRVAVSSEQRNAYLSSGVGSSDLLNGRLRYRWKPSDKLDMTFTLGRQQIYGTGVALGALSYEGFYTPWRNCTQSGLSGATYDCSDTTGSGAGVLSRGYPPTFGHVDNAVSYKDRSDPWDDGMPAGNWGHDVFARTKINSFSANIDWDLGVGTLSVVPSFDNGTYRSAEAGGPGNFVSEHNHWDTRQIDVHLNSAESSAFTWLVGANYYYYDQPGAFEFTIYPGAAGPGGPCANTAAEGNCYRWQGNNQSSQTTKAVYGNATVPVLDALRLVGGLRYTKDEKGTQGNGGVIPGDANGPIGSYVWGPVYKGDWSKLTYRAGVEYDLRPASMAYLTYSTGYQPGNILVTNAVNATKAQTISQWTIGLKNRFLDDRLQVNVEAFNSEYHNRGQQGAIVLGSQTTGCVAPPGPPPSLIVASDYSCLVASAAGLTIPNLTSRGADLEVSWLPSSADRVEFALEYLKATQEAPVATTPVTEAAIIAAAGTAPPDSTTVPALLAGYNAAVASYAGATLQSSPKLSGNFTYAHTFSLANGGTLVPRVNAAYKSSYWTSGQGLPQGLTPNNPGPAEQDAYAIYNAYLQYSNADGRFTATGYIKNISNKPVLLDYSGANSFRGAASVSLGDPRTFGVILEASF